MNTPGAGAAPGGFFRDLAYLLAGSGSQHVFLLMLQLILARNLPVAEFGRLSFYNGVLSLYFLVGTAGIASLLPALARRRAAAGEAPPHAMAVWATGISAAFALANLGAWAMGAYDRFRVDLGSLCPWISATLVPVCLTAALQSILIGYGKTRMVFHIGLWTEAAKPALALGLLAAGAFDAVNLAAGWAAIYWAGALATSIPYLRWARRFPRAELGPLGWSPGHGEAIAYLIPANALTLTSRLLVFFTGAFRSADDSARLAVALVFMSAFGVVLMPFQTALLSHLQAYRTGGNLAAFVRDSAWKLAGLILAAGAAASLAGIFATDLLFGAGLGGPASFIPLLALLFALDGPRALLDVFSFTFLPKAGLAVAEGLRMLGMAGLFLWFRDRDFWIALALTAALCACVNAAKGARVAAYLRARGAGA